MRFALFISLAALMACLNTCKKNSPPIVDVPIDPIDTIIPPPQDSHIIELGKVYVLKNGETWDVPFNAWFFHSDSVFLIEGKQTYANGITESFNINDIPCKPGRYPFEFWPTTAALSPNQIPHGSFGMIYDGDQPVGNFFLDTTRQDHFIEILRFDTSSNVVEGLFQIATKKQPSNGLQLPGVPDSIIMSKGKFRLEVKDF